MSELTGTILTPEGWRIGRIAFGDLIETVEGGVTGHPSPPFILPGFVDLHVHGGGGGDMMAGADQLRQAARLHLRHGTTSMLATSITAPVAQIEAFLDAAREAHDTLEAGASRIVGVHLEGPFINPGKLGAQPPFAIPADTDLFAQWLARAPIKTVTFAPECDADGALLALMRAHGIRVQIGHTLCSYAQAARAIACGCGVTHLYNAMEGLAHRGNGAVGAALAHADYAEIIPDLIHAEPGAILAARRAIPHLYGITDATAGAGMPDGPYRLGSHDLIKKDGAMRLADGTLAGSALTMDQALRNLVRIGLPLDEATRRLSTIPAEWIGLDDAGQIKPGRRADLLVFDADLILRQIWIAGHAITPHKD